MAALTFDGDPRLYIQSKPSPQSRFYVHCQSTEMRDGVICRCTFSQRIDDFKRNLMHSTLHKYIFAPVEQLCNRQLRLDAFRRLDRQQGERITPIVHGVAVFMAKTNVSASTICKGNLHSLLLAVYKSGWVACASCNPEKTDMQSAKEAADRAILRFTSSMMGKALEVAYAEERSELLSIFRQYPYVGLSIDGVTIKSRKFLNLDIVNPTSKILPFTYDFLENSTFTASEFGDHLARILNEMQADKLTIAGVTSDGCPFQVKALSWRDLESLQQRYEQWRKILLIPCMCHRLQNSMTELYRSNRDYRRLIGQARDASVLLRTPRAREALKAGCPTHCATRWIHDYPIVRFIIDHFDVAVDILSVSDLTFDPQFIHLLPLLEQFFLTARAFEADDPTLSAVYPQITSLLESFSRHGQRMECRFVRRLDQHSAQIIRKRTLDTTHNVFHLAYLLTPAGRMQACSESLPNPCPTQKSEDSDEDPLDHVRFLNESDQTTASSDDEDILRVYAPPEPAAGEGPAGESPASEPDVRPQQFGVAEEEDGDADDPPSDGDERSPDDTLCSRAEAALKEILAQWNIDTDLADHTLGTFQGYVTSAPVDLRMRAIPDTNRYPWGILSGSDPHWVILSDIALRLEALVCTEAVSERTNGAMRRLPSPFRMKMGRDVLLSRLTNAKHMSIRSDAKEQLTASIKLLIIPRTRAIWHL